MDQKQIQHALNIFTDRVKNRFAAEQVFLFGSYARGNATEYSDVDLVVIARQFSDIPEDRRFDLLYDLTTGLTPDFHVYGFTPQEFDNTSPLTTLSDIKREGIPLLTPTL
ncbi:nucleotidyltransferase domain-containing protein [Candidatus Gottesmanbacteria bacterium]|nr:nucleotidyltransferase domain-containing protein [Candidatus Gottesmanbacteria bacterium]